MANVKTIPDGYTSAIPYLIVQNAAEALTFYANAFQASVITRMDDPSGKIMHAELKVGAALFMLADENAEWGTKSPVTLGDTPVSMMIYVADVDAFVERALAAGASVVVPAQDQFFGDRMATLGDPFGHRWMIATHIEDVSEHELAKRIREMFAS